MTTDKIKSLLPLYQKLEQEAGEHIRDYKPNDDFHIDIIQYIYLSDPTAKFIKELKKQFERINQ